MCLMLETVNELLLDVPLEAVALLLLGVLEAELLLAAGEPITCTWWPTCACSWSVAPVS
jgi:hypothetical protein